MLLPMCDDLKRQFYAACPVWYWLVLWWNLLVMERHLARLYAASGRVEMTYGLALGPHGQLRLVFLSDAARCIAESKAMSAPAYHLAHPIKLQSPEAGYAGLSNCTGEGARMQLTPVRTALLTTPLYLDPG